MSWRLADGEADAEKAKEWPWEAGLDQRASWRRGHGWLRKALVALTDWYSHGRRKSQKEGRHGQGQGWQK